MVLLTNNKQAVKSIEQKGYGKIGPNPFFSLNRDFFSLLRVFDDTQSISPDLFFLSRTTTWLVFVKISLIGFHSFLPPF